MPRTQYNKELEKFPWYQHAAPAKVGSLGPTTGTGSSSRRPLSEDAPPQTATNSLRGSRDIPRTYVTPSSESFFSRRVTIIVLTDRRRY
jgi:hypothetical protein